MTLEQIFQKGYEISLHTPKVFSIIGAIILIFPVILAVAVDIKVRKEIKKKPNNKPYSYL